LIRINRSSNADTRPLLHGLFSRSEKMLADVGLQPRVVFSRVGPVRLYDVAILLPVKSNLAVVSESRTGAMDVAGKLICSSTRGVRTSSGRIKREAENRAIGLFEACAISSAITSNSDEHDVLDARGTPKGSIGHPPVRPEARLGPLNRHTCCSGLYSRVVSDGGGDHLC
jgi:hypothetical protein